MNSPRKLKFCLLAITFLASFAIPSYYDANGFLCLITVAFTVLTPEFNNWMYYYTSTFLATNIITAYLLYLGLFTNKELPAIISRCYIALMMHSISFLLIADLAEIQIGFYLWLGSILLLCYEVNIAKTEQNGGGNSAKLRPSP